MQSKSEEAPQEPYLYYIVKGTSPDNCAKIFFYMIFIQAFLVVAWTIPLDKPCTSPDFNKPCHELAPVSISRKGNEFPRLLRYPHRLSFLERVEFLWSI